MVSLEDIPFKERWKIASKSASFVPLMYDSHFRKVLGEKYDEIERPIWIEAGKEIKNLAMSLGLPSGNARQIGETLGIINSISYGPESRYETLEETKHGVIGKMTGCAILNSAMQMGLDPKIVALPACRTLIRSAVESLNPDYTILPGTMNMCSGDNYCELVIERRR